MARGNARMAIYLDDREWLYFIDLLGEVVLRYRLWCNAYCLMPNHYHLLLETEGANLSDAVRQLNGVYGQWWNRRHERVGHVFQGRFKAQLVQDQRYYLHVSRYILRNPVRGGLVAHPSAWRWSSARATTGEAHRPEWLRIDSLLAATDESADGKGFRRFLEGSADREEIVAAVKSDARVIGDDAFVKRFDRQLRAGHASEVPARERCAARPTLAELFATAGSRRARNEAAWAAHACHGYRQTEIAAFLGVHYTTISRRLTSRRRRPPSDQRADPGTDRSPKALKVKT